MSAAPHSPKPPPAKIGPYQVVGRLAKGGMAELFLGRRFGPQGFARSVAIKRILAHLAESESFVSMFLDEARIAAAIQHPNVVNVEDLAYDEDGLYMVMEYLNGEPLSALVRAVAQKGQQIDPDVVVHIIQQAAAGLHAAHELRGTDGAALNVVHRDVSPHNLFVGYDGTVKVLDFGIAHAADRLTKTESGSVKGKWSYMAPEQVRERPLDRRTDVFALGVVLFELLTLRRLFRRDTPAGTVQALLNNKVPAPSSLRQELPRSLDPVCARALQREPSERYPTAAELRRELMDASPRQKGDLPEDKLKALMALHFTDRILAKRQMIRSVQEGGAVAEVIGDDQVSDASAVPRVASQTQIPAATRSRKWLYGAILALLATSLIVVGWWLGSRPGPTVTDEPDPVAAPADPLPEPARTVMISVQSTPAGATVTGPDGQSVTTPGELELPRGSETVALRFELEGHEGLTEEVSSDLDQRIRVQLIPVPEPTRPRMDPRPSPMVRQPMMQPAAMMDPFQIWE